MRVLCKPVLMVYIGTLRIARIFVLYGMVLWVHTCTITWNGYMLREREGERGRGGEKTSGQGERVNKSE